MIRRARRERERERVMNGSRAEILQHSERRVCLRVKEKGKRRERERDRERERER